MLHWIETLAGTLLDSVRWFKFFTDEIDGDDRMIAGELFDESTPSSDDDGGGALTNV